MDNKLKEKTASESWHGHIECYISKMGFELRLKDKLWRDR